MFDLTRREQLEPNIELRSICMNCLLTYRLGLDVGRMQGIHVDNINFGYFYFVAL